MVNLAAKGIIGIVGLFYAYGAFVHVLNMLSLTGFDWMQAPWKWKALDIIYLGLDLVVVIGLLRQWKVAYIAFYLAAISQMVLYTLFRAWIIDVPEEFAVSPEQESYLSTLVIFHIVTLVLVTIVLRATRKNP